MLSAFIEDIRENPVHYVSRLILLTVGSLISAFSVATFFLPSSIAPTGITGLAVILQELFSTPIGPVILLANIPIQIIAFRVLDGWKTVAFTVYSVVLYSLAIEVFQTLLGDINLTNDEFLSAVCGGVISGIGGGLIYRAGGTVGGTSSIAQMVRHKFGLPLSTASMFGDSVIVVLAGIVLGWEAALYALIAVFITRIASDYVLEGPSDTCTALVITDNAEEITDNIAEALGHGTSKWSVEGIDNQHDIVLVSMLRSEIHRFQHVVRDTDDSAFVTILTGQSVYGKGFQSIHPQMPLGLDEVEA